MTVQDAVHRWLDEAAGAMGGDPAHRKDVLLELETTIYDRIEERTQKGEPEEAAVTIVLRTLGEPAHVAQSLLPGRPLIDAHRTRSFVINAIALFTVHMLFVIAATVAGSDTSFTFLQIDAIPTPRDPFAVVGRALRVLFFDLGILLAIYAVLPRLQRWVRMPGTSLAVRPDARRCVETAFFFALVLLVVNVLRDDLLALYLRDGAHVVPLTGPGVIDNIPWLNTWLVLGIVRELLYARFGERRSTLTVDLLSNAAGLVCLLGMVASRTLVDLSGARDWLGPTVDSLDALLNTMLTLIVVGTAGLIAWRFVYRGYRWLQRVRR